MALGALAAPTAARAQMGAAVKLGEVTPGGVADEDDVSAAPAVAAVGTALGHVRLAAEGDRAVAAFAAAHEDHPAVVEHPARIGSARVSRVEVLAPGD